MKNHVVGLFDDSETADHAVQDLFAAGFPPASVSVLTADPHGALYRQLNPQPEGTMAAEGAAAGLTSGAVLGGLLGLAIGIGLFFVPIGLLAAGPIAGLLAGGTAGATTGGLLGALVGVGVHEKDVDIYAECVHRGGTLVTVEAGEEDVERAHAILSRDGAIDINDRAVKLREEGFLRFDPSSPTYTAHEPDDVRRQIAQETGALDDEQAYRERTFGPGPSTGSGSYDEEPPEDR